MKRVLFGLFSSLFICCTVSAQQSYKPTAILLPDIVWMNDHGFVEEKTQDGTTVKCYKYADALSKDRDMSDALRGIQQLFQERMFQVIDRETIVNSPEANENINSLINSLHPDIRMYLDYSVKEMGLRKNITWSLAAYDVYCGQLMARISDAVEFTMDPVSYALQKRLAGKIDDFINQMFIYIMDLRDNGRMVNLRFTSGDSVDYGKDMVDGQLLKDYLHQWIRQRAVGGDVKTGRQQNNLCEFLQVRIPFFTEQGDLLLPSQWADSILEAFVKDSGLKIKRDSNSPLDYITFIIGE